MPLPPVPPTFHPELAERFDDRWEPCGVYEGVWYYRAYRGGCAANYWVTDGGDVLTEAPNGGVWDEPGGRTSPPPAWTAHATGGTPVSATVTGTPDAPNLELVIPPGTPGAGGLSAFQIAVDAGFVGTIPQWLASLVGQPGNPGSPGPPGPPGASPPPLATPVFSATATSGSPAGVSVTGTYPNITLVFTIPSGTNGTNGTNANVRAGSTSLTLAALSVDVSFSSPLPNANYRVAVGPIASGITLSVSNKTVNGFRFSVLVAVALTISWIAVPDQ